MDDPSVIAGLITEEPDIIRSTDAAIVEAVAAGNHRLVNLLLEQGRKVVEKFEKLAQHPYYQGRSAEELLEMAKNVDPTATSKRPYVFLDFIYKLMKPKGETPNIIIWEDGERLAEALRKFVEYKPKAQSAQRSIDKGDTEGAARAGIQDVYKVAKLSPEIGRYKELEQLEQDIDSVEDGLGLTKQKEGEAITGLDKSLLRPGASWVKRSKHYAIMKITDPQSLYEYGRGTRWCTFLHGVGTAKHYIDQGKGAVYIIWQQKREDGPWTKVIQFQPDFSMFNDVKDSRVKPEGEMASLVEPSPEDVAKDPLRVIGYAEKFHQDGWPEMEPLILKYPKTAAKYAVSIKKGRWKEAEAGIMKNPAAAVDYVANLLKGSGWQRQALIPKEEATEMLKGLMPQIAKNPKVATDFALGVLNDRWKEAEPIILKDPAQAVRYNQELQNHFPDGVWSELEKKMATTKNAWAASRFATSIKGRAVPEIEPAILRNLDAATEYHKTRKGKWPELEAAILKNGRPDHVLKYGKTSKSRFEEGENLLLQQPVYAVEYHSTLRDLFPDGRWEPLERSIIQTRDPQAAYDYTVKTQGWPEGEEILAQDQDLAIQYAAKIGKRFPAGDKLFLDNLDSAFRYLETIRGEGAYHRKIDRWPELEERIKDDASKSMEYAHLIGHRFEAAEGAIITDPIAAQKYMEDFKDDFKDGWPEIEPLASTYPSLAGVYAAITCKRLPEFEKRFRGDRAKMAMYAMGLALCKKEAIELEDDDDDDLPF